MMTTHRSAVIFSALILMSCFIALSHQKGEVVLNQVSAAMPSAECIANMYKRPCLNQMGQPIANYPDDYPCPCRTGSGGAIIGQGKPATPNADLGFFTEETIVSGAGDFSNVIAFAFTDNTQELYVATKQGIAFHVDLKSGIRNTFINLADEVNNAGDKGMMSIETHPDFANNRLVYIFLVVDLQYGGADDPMNNATFSRVVSYRDVNGVADPNSRKVLIGQTPATGIPSCFQTHIGGAMAFGHDGSLFITTGDGAHWDFNDGDYGQDRIDTDPACRELFGEDEDIGMFRSQKIDSLGGKLLRINPANGQGICAGSGFQVLNPFCSSNANDKRSKVYALGLRNPFTMNVRPKSPEDPEGWPGVPYFGDVGDGGYEEVNAVTIPGMNFGWPCWEGPFPMVKHRDSPRNTDPTINFLVQNGLTVNCPNVYKNLTTHMPYFYYSRFPQNDNAGYFQENAYLGLGFLGNTIAGVAFYTGDLYPPQYKNTVWIAEFSQMWIRVTSRDSTDKYTSVQDYRQLSTSVLSLETDPNTGNICYAELNGGRVRAIKYVSENIPPTVKITPTPSSGAAPLTVSFSLDGTFDRDNDAIDIKWIFGDNSASTNEPNPKHTYNNAGTYFATAVVTDKYGNVGNQTVTISVNGNTAPTVRITSPVAGANGLATYTKGQTVTFAADVNDNDKPGLKYRWEIQIVHLNHIHSDSWVVLEPSFTTNVAAIGAGSHGGERCNLRAVLTVTDAQGLVTSDDILLVESDWSDIYGGNRAPVPSFTIGGYQPFLVGQVVQFDATLTNDADLDYVWYSWDFGDGNTQTGWTPTHIYGAAGTYDVKLTVRDNWAGTNTLTKKITVGARAAIEPAITPEGGERFNDVRAQFSSISATSSIRYTMDGSDPSAASPLYTKGSQVTVPFDLNKNVTLKARAFENGLGASPVAATTYSFKAAPCSQMVVFSGCCLTCNHRETSVPDAKLIRLPTNNQNPPPVNSAAMLTYTVGNVTGSYDSTKQYTRITTHLDADTAGQIAGARVMYDWTGDGTFDRVEVFNIFPTDPVSGSWETFSTASANPFQQVTGSNYAALNRGTVRVDLYQAGGSLNTQMKILLVDNANSKETTIDIPYTAFKVDNGVVILPTTSTKPSTSTSNPATSTTATPSSTTTRSSTNNGQTTTTASSTNVPVTSTSSSNTDIPSATDSQSTVDTGSNTDVEETNTSGENSTTSNDNSSTNTSTDIPDEQEGSAVSTTVSLVVVIMATVALLV